MIFKNNFIQQVDQNLIKSDSKNIHSVLKASIYFHYTKRATKYLILCSAEETNAAFEQHYEE